MCSLRCIVIGQKCPESFTVLIPTKSDGISQFSQFIIYNYFLVLQGKQYFIPLHCCQLSFLVVSTCMYRHLFIPITMTPNLIQINFSRFIFHSIEIKVHVYIDLSISTIFQERLIILTMQDGTLQEREGVNENLKMKLIWPKERRIIRCQFCPSVCHSLLICIAKLV